MTTKNLPERVAFSPGEFAQLFGKSQTWGYRQIYAGKVKAITEHGRILIPAAELDAILKTAGIYDGKKPKKVLTKAEVQDFIPKLENAWSSFLAARRTKNRQHQTPARTPTRKINWPSSELAREGALKRLARRT